MCLGWSDLTSRAPLTQMAERPDWAIYVSSTPARMVTVHHVERTAVYECFRVYAVLHKPGVRRAITRFPVEFSLNAPGTVSSLPEKWWNIKHAPDELIKRLKMTASFCQATSDGLPGTARFVASLSWCGIRVMVDDDEVVGQYADVIGNPMTSALEEVFSKDFADAVMSFVPKPEFAVYE